MNDLKDSLVNYGRWILSKQLEKDGSKYNEGFANNENIEKARKIIGKTLSEPDDSPKFEKLKTIFSFVRPRCSKACHTSHFPLKQLSIELYSNQSEGIDYLWNKFNEEFDKLPKDIGKFETFYNLYRKYAWYIPGSIDGISLFEQFKAVTAISHCLEKGTKELLLVGGDLPGIQSMLYTITSKGAAKSLRGRSFYLQILCDILVQTVIRELSLPSANIIYSAGGNFKMLASAQDKETLQSLRSEINSRLLDAHRGDLFAAMDWVELNVEDAVKGDVFKEKMDKLAKKIATQKRTWFAEHAGKRYNDIFGVQGKGGPISSELEAKNYCEVCHVEVSEETRKVDDEGTTKCHQCQSFEELSPILNRNFLIIGSLEESLTKLHPIDDKYRTKPFGKPGWKEAIRSLDFECAFENSDPEPNDKTSIKNRTIYKLNDCAFLPENIHPNWEYGFRFIGKTTPFMDEADAYYMEKESEEAKPGDIKNTNVMADRHSTGIKRYGILRMDVDWLGSVFSERLIEKDMLHTSALSASLSLFFNGWLNCICESVDQNWRQKVSDVVGSKDELSKSKLPYIIYSGGDDLFIVGSWDVMPILAERIRNDFVNYVSNGYVSDKPVESTPCMTISAGISIFTTKFPIYQAAELAKEALEDRAKGMDKKDAIDFLGMPVGWKDFEAIKNMAFELSEMMTKKDDDKIPRSLLTLLKQIADTYAEDAKKGESNGVIYGKWMWQLAYSLQNMKERTKSPKLKEQIMKIGGSVYDLGTVNGSANWKMIKYLGLPVRWAEFLTRGGQ